MCGIIGYIDRRGGASADLVAAMAAAIAYRGPDDCGAWIDAEYGIAFGHRRLSIVDLSPEGHQPKISPSGRFIITFNGEIYNFADIKSDLIARGHTFRGTGDTEMMLSAFEEWGVEAALKQFSGMFAFAVWDKKDRVVHIARDRMGEKPLYYGWSKGVFFFGSDLKGMRKHPAFEAQVNRDALTQLLRHGYIPAPHSIYRGIFKLPAAGYLRLAIDDAAGPRGTFSEFLDAPAQLKPENYWNLREVVLAHDSFKGSDAEALQGFEDVLTKSVGLQMVADVPLGAFLSGGIDSSTIVALMQRQSSRPVKTFSIGFNEKDYNEAQFAKEVARHLKTEHTELYVTAKDTLDVVPLLPQIYSEPFGDSSQIPTYLVAKLARQHVTVSLSGDAGDELFGGYPRYLWSQKLWSYIGTVPGFLRQPVTSGVRAIPPRVLNKMYALLRPVLPHSFSFSDFGYKAHKAASFMSSPSPTDLYFQLFSLWDKPSSIVIDGKEPETVHSARAQWPQGLSFLQQMMWLDAETYLPDDILVKVDRAAMAVSLETRVPLLDHRVIEYVWTLPDAMRVRGVTTKWLLRQLLFKYVPRQLIERPKKGFGAPINAWLRGPLRDWAEALLDETRLKNEGFFRPEEIRLKWREHLDGTRDWQYLLWHILMFQAWNEAQ